MTTTQTFKSGQCIITEGDPATSAYMIISGHVRVSLQKNGRTITLAELGPQAIFGESALLGRGGVYGATVEASSNTELSVISPEDLRKAIDSSDPMIKALIEMLIDRQNKTNQALLNSETREFIDIGFI